MNIPGACGPINASLGRSKPTFDLRGRRRPTGANRVKKLVKKDIWSFLLLWANSREGALPRHLMSTALLAQVMDESNKQRFKIVKLPCFPMP